MKQTIFNENQILFLQKLTDDWQTFDEISQKTGFSIEEIKFLIMDFIEFQNYYKRKSQIKDFNFWNAPNVTSLASNLNFILLSPNFDKVKIGRDGILFVDDLELKEEIKERKKYLQAYSEGEEVSRLRTVLNEELLRIVRDRNKK